jgi:hypothetical protein
VELILMEESPVATGSLENVEETALPEAGGDRVSVPCPEFDPLTVMKWVSNGDPINIYGYMGAGKTTLCEALKHLGYNVIDETLWDTLASFFPQLEADASLRGKFYAAVGVPLAQAVETALDIMALEEPSAIKRLAINSWIPHSQHTKNLYLLVERPEVLATRPLIAEGGETAQGHYQTVYGQAQEYFTDENSAVLCTDIDQARLMAAIDEMHGGTL